MARKDKSTDSVYRVTEVIGTSAQSWEDAAKTAVETAAGTLRDLRIAEIVKMDVKIEDGKVVEFRYATAAVLTVRKLVRTNSGAVGPNRDPISSRTCSHCLTEDGHRPDEQQNSQDSITSPQSRAIRSGTSISMSGSLVCASSSAPSISTIRERIIFILAIGEARRERFSHSSRGRRRDAECAALAKSKRRRSRFHRTRSVTGWSDSRNTTSPLRKHRRVSAKK